jgi:hypothetical protein
MPAPSDRSGTDGGLVMGRIVHAVETLWLERWSTLIARPVTVAATGDLVTLANHHLADTTPVVFGFTSGGDPLADGTTYYVRDATADTFKVAATSGGAAINITVDGVGSVWASPRPAYIDQALIMQAAALYDRRKTLNGVVAGSEALGPFRVGRFDPDIERLIDDGSWGVR